MKVYEKLLLENKAWAKEKVEDDPDYFKRLASIQTPKFRAFAAGIFAKSALI